MHISMKITLGFHFLLCRPVSSSRYSILENQSLSLVNDITLLGEFFDQLNTSFLQTTGIREVVSIGASASVHQQALQPVRESFPYVACTNPEICIHPKSFGSHTSFVVFLEDLTEETFKANMKNLPGGSTRSRFMFVFEGTMLESDAALFLRRTIKRGLMRSRLANITTFGIRLYSFVLEEGCIPVVGSGSVWRPGTVLSRSMRPSVSRVNNLRGCPVSVSTIRSIPKMEVKEEKDGTLSVVGGHEGKLLLLLAERLNFTIAANYPFVAHKHRNVFPTEYDILDDVASGRAQVGIGQLRPANDLRETMRFSTKYGAECVCWAVPRRMSRSFDVVWTEYPWDIWALIGLVFATSCGFVYVHQHIDPSANGNRKNGLSEVVLDALSINLGYPVIHVTVSTGGRIMLVAYLLYATVTTTGYKSSLASILATKRSAPSIVDDLGIINAGLKVGGSPYNRAVLTAQENVSEIVSKLNHRSEVIKNRSEAVHRLKLSGDFAYLASLSTLQYEKMVAQRAQELITFDILKDCVTVVPIVMYFSKSAFIREPINSLIQRMIESGILEHQVYAQHSSDKILDRRNAEKEFKARVRQKIYSQSILFFSCLVPSVLVFFIELVTAASTKHNKTKPMVHRRQLGPRTFYDHD